MTRRPPRPIAPECCGARTTTADRSAGLRAARTTDLAPDVLALLVTLIGYACPACGWWAGCPVTLLDTASTFHGAPVGPRAWDELHRRGVVHPRAYTRPDDRHAADLPVELDLELPACAAGCDCARCRLVPATVTDLADYRRSTRTASGTGDAQAAHR